MRGDLLSGGRTRSTLKEIGISISPLCVQIKVSFTGVRTLLSASLQIPTTGSRSGADLIISGNDEADYLDHSLVEDDPSEIDLSEFQDLGFRLEDGQSGRGDVRKGLQGKTGQLVALKKTRLEMDEEGIPPTSLREMNGSMFSDCWMQSKLKRMGCHFGPIRRSRSIPAIKVQIPDLCPLP